MHENTTQHEKRGPGRPKKERRRRQDGSNIGGKRLGVSQKYLEFDKFKYRWVNDEPARIQSKTEYDDWDIVLNQGGVVKEDASDLGDAVSIVVGTTPDGAAKRAYLCRKPKAYFEEDRRKKMEELDKQLEQIRRGNARDGSEQADYVPHTGISIR